MFVLFVFGYESVGWVIVIGDVGVCVVDGFLLWIGDCVVWLVMILCWVCDCCF